MTLVKNDQVRLGVGLRPLIGTMMGVGLFGLPYVLAQVGWRIGVLAMLLVAAVNIVVLLAYAELALVSPGGHKARFIGVVSEHLGIFGKYVTGAAFFALQWGAMIVYIIAGGLFAQTLLGPWLGGSALQYSEVFWLLSSVLMIGGLRFAMRVERFLIPIFLVLIVALAVLARPYVHGAYLLTMHPAEVWATIGALFFAFHGFSAIPEMRDAVHGAQKPLYRAIVWGTVLVTGIYILFTATVVGMTGRATTVEALSGLKDISPWFMLVGSAAGLTIVTTAFLAIGDSVKHTLLYDVRLRYVTAWVMAAGVPFVVFVLGARNFLDVMRFTGGVLGSICAITIIVAYERARLSHLLPRQILRLPQWAVFTAFLLFMGAMVWSWPGVAGP